MFNLTKDELTEKKAIQTAKEIHHQPSVWKETISYLLENKESIRGFVEGIYSKHDNVRVIFTGAGTSAYTGDALVPELNRQNQGKVQFESIATTDIVSNPTEYLYKDTPTILVSFARSGNSPESVAAVSLGKDIVKHFYQVNITCNKDGELSENAKGDDNSLTIFTPEKAHDQSISMTSSFTSMIIIAYAVFSTHEFTGESMNNVISSAEGLLESMIDQIEEIVALDFDRVVYLGSGLLAQLGHDSALKMLELSGGQVVAIHESSLGFRHGPKSILSDSSVVVLYMSQDPYTRKYDKDILREIAADESNLKVVVVADKVTEEIKELADWAIPVVSGDTTLTNDFDLGLLYAVFGQVFAMKKSIQLGIEPDDPSPTGRVNRVVEGVTIYER